MIFPASVSLVVYCYTHLVNSHRVIDMLRGSYKYAADRTSTLHYKYVASDKRVVPTYMHVTNKF